ncbi:MAG: PASTA domain-containing protein, partial [Oscillospiraceae bacterium]|nr:PASTA domain-containing protein [Oscillospiraceae bacterium]
HAHDKGIVHRDIKPQNIMLLQNGTIKVTDFGIARFSRGETRTLAENGAIGSVHYISPEQARGELTYDKADIYSVGVVLYEMLTGQLPFQADSAVSVAIMQVQSEPKPPREINRIVPVGFEQITMRAMQKNVADRYQSAAEMLLDLDEFKRNPQVKFIYPISTSVADLFDNRDERPAGKKPDEENGYKEIKKEKRRKKRSYTLPILSAVLVGIIDITAVLVMTVYKNIFSTVEVPVPSFINMQYDEVVRRYGNDFKFEMESAYSSDYESGIVFKQSEAANTRIKSDKTIKLTVAMARESIPIPGGLVGLQLNQVRTQLRALGFETAEKPEYNHILDEGAVIRTDPDSGVAEIASTITIYYVTKSTDAQTTGTAEAETSSGNVSVPDLTGSTVEIAKQKLQYLGLEAGEITKASSSIQNKDIVLSQTPAKDSSVAPGAKVNLVIGDGIPSNVPVGVEIKLPSVSGEKANLTASVSNEAIAPMDVDLDGGNITITFIGSGSPTGENRVYKVYLDKALYCEGTINFNVSPPDCSSPKYHAFTVTKAIPKVDGEYSYDAVKLLEEAGFKNYKIVTQATNNLEPGIVMSQSPAAGAGKKYAFDTEITLTVSRAAAANATTAPPAPTTTKPPPTTDGDIPPRKTGG